MFRRAKYFVEDYWKIFFIIVSLTVLAVITVVNLSTIKHELGFDHNLSGLKIKRVVVLKDEVASTILLQELMQKGAQLDVDQGTVISGKSGQNSQGVWVLAVNTNDNISVVAETPWFMGDMIFYTSKIDTLEVLSSGVAEKLTTFYHKNNVKKED